MDDKWRAGGPSTPLGEIVGAAGLTLALLAGCAFAVWIGHSLVRAIATL